MPATSTAMHGLLSKLRSAGISPKFAQRMLPPWWDDEVASDPAGLQQAQLFFARTFNIELKSLTTEGEALRFRVTPRKFKLSRNVVEETVLLSANYVTGIARVALQGFPFEQTLPFEDPLHLREVILQRHQCVSLEALLEWCLSAGVPVMHVEELPGKKMTGIVVRDDGRYAIVLSKKAHPSLLLFHLAHEVGHIAKRHLPTDGVVADDKIDDGNADQMEKDADTYAVRLLNGRDARYAAQGQILNAKALFEAASRRGVESRVDVGHVIANFAHHQNRWPMGNLALAQLSEPKHGGGMINAAFFQAMDVGRLSEDQQDLLKAATQFEA